jgi:hypothetical protein
MKRKSLWALCIYPIMWDVSEKFKRIGNRYKIRTLFKTKRTLRSSRMKTSPERDPLQTHSACTVSPVNVAEATLAKQADL